MEILKYCKLQIGIFLLLLFISYLFVKDGNRLNRKSHASHCNKYFDYLFVLGEVAVFFDGFTAYTVNHLEQVPPLINLLAHLIYLLSYQSFIFVHFLYWLVVTDRFPKKTWKKFVCYGPIAVSECITIIFIKDIRYEHGVYTNYSMGISAYACFAAIAIYCIAAFAVFIQRQNYIQRNKQTAFIMALSAMCIITLIQIVYPETLIAVLAIIAVVLSLYMCMENPSIKYLEYYHSEMVMGFATLVESKDGSTGGHIRRSSAYAVLIAQELRKNKKYSNRISKDYIENLRKAAPMHDVGKIGVPDAILQKPGKLTDEEYDTMKKHPEIGGRIIQETFGHLDDEDYEHMAYKVAVCHHEKWNGKGYPNQLSGENIPLCARIMAVADVFDAVSAKRCYREALPLSVCYDIIEKGRGTDFDPDVVDSFFAVKDEIEKIYNED